MSKTCLSLITALLLSLSLSATAADQAKGDGASAQATDSENTSLMDQPVDFSSPEKVEETLENIREQDGERAYKAVKSAMAYVLYYDLSLKNDEALLHKKLNGMTPRQILDKMRR